MINKNSTKAEVLEAIKQNHAFTLGCMSDELRGDRDFVMAAVSLNGWALKYANLEFRSDRDFVLKVVNQNGLALRCASDEFRDDREVVLKAVQQNKYAVDFASEALRIEMAQCWAKCMEQGVKND